MDSKEKRPRQTVFNNYLGHNQLMNIYTTNNNKQQLNFDFRFADMRLVCDECASPLRLYGENFIETYTNDKANVLRCLCDLHADEMGVRND